MRNSFCLCSLSFIQRAFTVKGGMAGRPRGVGRHALICAGACTLTCLALVSIWMRPSAKGLCYAMEGVFRQPEVMMPSEKYTTDEKGERYVYSRDMPLVFIGGMPRSGTTLLRALLDSHPDVRCGEETRVIPRLIGLKSQWMKSPLEAGRLREAGVTSQVLDSAVAAFTLEIIARHGDPATRLCNKDPFTLRSSVYLNQLFPNAKFILMVRDGRAVVHSIISRKVTITGMDLHDYRQCLRRWSAAVQAMFSQCHMLGPRICLPVHYERLVLHPEASMRKILAFLDLPWNESVLHHEMFVGKKGGISLSILERSTDQVIKPINTEALTKWVGHMPPDVVRDMPALAPMLAALGYDPRANPPHYGEPDTMVIKNTGDLAANKKLWEARERQVAEKRDNIWKSWLQNARTRTTASNELPITPTLQNYTSLLKVNSSENSVTQLADLIKNESDFIPNERSV